MNLNTPPRGAGLHVDHVRSHDGTRIGYRRLGAGPGLIVLHGSMQGGHSHLQLAEALADHYTVYLPDRRDHRLSGPAGPNYGMAREVEDLEALQSATAARYVFGVSSSGLIALEAARAHVPFDKVAVYEPAVLLDRRHTRWIARYDEEMRKGNVAAAMVASMKGLRLGPPLLNVMPTAPLAALTNLALNSEDKKAGPEDVTMRELAGALGNEGRLLDEASGQIDNYRTVDAEVLLLVGTKGLRILTPGLNALEQTLPQVRRVDLRGLDHGSSADPSTSNRGGKPQVVAAELRQFFAIEGKQT